MAHFNKDELVGMVACYYSAAENQRATLWLYEQYYPNGRQPSRKTVQTVVARFEATCSVIQPPRQQTKRMTGAENPVMVLAAVAAKPHISTRALQREHNINKSSVQCILCRNKQRPYHVHCHRGLVPGDEDKRVRFVHRCYVCLRMTLTLHIM